MQWYWLTLIQVRLELVQNPCFSTAHCWPLDLSHMCELKLFFFLLNYNSCHHHSLTPKSSGVGSRHLFPYMYPAIDTRNSYPTSCANPCEKSDRLPKIMFYIESCTCKKCWNSNVQYLWLWPNLEIESLQMIKLRWSH